MIFYNGPQKLNYTYIVYISTPNSDNQNIYCSTIQFINKLSQFNYKIIIQWNDIYIRNYWDDKTYFIDKNSDNFISKFLLNNEYFNFLPSLHKTLGYVLALQCFLKNRNINYFFILHDTIDLTYDHDYISFKNKIDQSKIIGSINEINI